jgi:hypothetical protein
MGRKTCTQPQCLYKGAFYPLTLIYINADNARKTVPSFRAEAFLIEGHCLSTIELQKLDYLQRSDKVFMVRTEALLLQCLANKANIMPKNYNVLVNR